MKKKSKTASTKATVADEEEVYELNYIVNIYDNHGTINITQTGKPDPDDPPPGGE